MHWNPLYILVHVHTYIHTYVCSSWLAGERGRENENKLVRTLARSVDDCWSTRCFVICGRVSGGPISASDANASAAVIVVVDVVCCCCGCVCVRLTFLPLRVWQMCHAEHVCVCVYGTYSIWVHMHIHMYVHSTFVCMSYVSKTHTHTAINICRPAGIDAYRNYTETITIFFSVFRLIINYASV